MNTAAMRTILLVILLVSAWAGFGQELSFKQFTVKDGLPGSTVYDAVQDQKGYIWFATNQGVSRFDGRTFTNLTKEDGLPDNEILKLYVDKHNNVWFISMLGIPSLWDGYTIRLFNECNDVTAIVEDFPKDSIYLISDKQPSFGYYRSLNANSKWKFSLSIKHTATNDNFIGWPLLRASNTEGLRFTFSIIRMGVLALTLEKNGRTRSYPFQIKPDKSYFAFHRRSFLSLSEDHKKILFSTSDSLFLADENSLCRILAFKDYQLNVDKDVDVASVFYDNDSTFWLCTRSKGLLCFRNYLNDRRTVQTSFLNSYCTSILKDREGGYWVTTHNDGVYYLPHLDFHYLNNPNLITKDVKCIKSTPDMNIVAGFADGSIIEIDPANRKENFHTTWHTLNKNDRVIDLLSHPEGLLAGSDRGLYNISHNQKPKRLVGLAVKGLYTDANKNILVSAAEGIYLLEKGKPLRMIFGKRTTCINGTGNTYFWGTRQGMYQWSDGELLSLSELDPGLSGMINHVDIAPDHSVWVSTQQGIFILKEGVLHTIKKDDGLSSQISKHILLKGSTAWVSTDQGISRVDYHWSANKLLYKISNITEEDGLISNDVNQTAYSKGYIWAATARGISYFSDQYQSTSNWNPLINVNKVIAGNRQVLTGDSLYLDQKQNRLTIELSGISFRSGKQIYYEYRFANQETGWNKVYNPTLEFSTLPYGHLNFEVRAVDRWGRRTDQPKKLTIFHPPPFWKTTWFAVLSYVLTALIIGLIMYFFSSNRQRKSEKEYQLKKKIHDLEMMALRAQMNPHFIFNCLSSIQHHILRADPVNANLYLHKLSTLIRKTLKRSTNSTILLAEEVAILQLYLEMEKLRLEDRLEYSISCAEDLLHEEISIPAMIIQPYVENAIKHGIAPLTDQIGYIRIEISRMDGLISFRIEDNGIGINSSRKVRSVNTQHEPMGMSITESRINTMNSIRKEQISVTVADRQDLNPEQRGTVVELLFHINDQS